MAVSQGVRAELLRRVADVRELYPLSGFNPLGVGGIADYFTRANDTAEVVAAVKAAIDAKIPYLVIGAAESVLFSDGGFPGLVIHNCSNTCVIASDRSQMIVDSGMPVRRFITQAAGQGFGGLVHLYPRGGTVGGAIYSNAGAEGRGILSSVRYVTVLMPPTKMKVDVTVMRYKPDWLLKEGEGETRLARQRREKGIEEPQPVVLNAHVQLTSVRNDELMRRIAVQASAAEAERPSGVAFGPLFSEVPGRSMAEVLKAAQLEKLRSDGLVFDKKYPNYLKLAGKLRPTAAGVWAMAEAATAEVKNVTGVELEMEFERVGAW